jgi:hypothetical protein
MKDDEVYGGGNSYTAEHWQYDPRTGRRWNVDPMAAEFAWQSTYTAFDNNPLINTDPTGMASEVFEGGGGGGGKKDPPQPLPSSGEMAIGAASHLGFAKNNTWLQATAGILDAIPTINTALNTATASLYRFYENPERLLGPVDLAYGVGDIYDQASTTIGKLAERDPYTIANTAAVAVQMAGGMAVGMKGSGPTIKQITSVEVLEIAEAPVTNEIYKRPSNATTTPQRKSVQGQPCVDCGATPPKMIADHKYILVKEWYETGKIDVKRMRSLEAVQPQCSSCSAVQAAYARAYSMRMRQIIQNRTSGN